MSANAIQNLVNSMDPEEAAVAIAFVMKKLFPLMDESARIKFVMDLVGDSEEGDVASLVHL